MMFSVSPEMLEHYSEQGYQILKLVEEEVDDVAAEAEQAIQSMSHTTEYHAPEPVARSINERG